MTYRLHGHPYGNISRFDIVAAGAFALTNKLLSINSIKILNKFKKIPLQFDDNVSEKHLYDVQPKKKISKRR